MRGVLAAIVVLAVFSSGCCCCCGPWGWGDDEEQRKPTTTLRKPTTTTLRGPTTTSLWKSTTTTTFGGGGLDVDDYDYYCDTVEDCFMCDCFCAGPDTDCPEELLGCDDPFLGWGECVCEDSWCNTVWE